MSHQFMEIPIVFTQCSPPEQSMGCLCFSAWPHIPKYNHTSFSAPAHHTAHALTFTNVYIVHFCVHFHKPSFLFQYLNLSPCRSAKTGPSTNSTIWLTRRPLTDLFHNLGCSLHCIGLLLINLPPTDTMRQSFC